jgi:hypothetical protein
LLEAIETLELDALVKYSFADLIPDAERWPTGVLELIEAEQANCTTTSFLRRKELRTLSSMRATTNSS